MPTQIDSGRKNTGRTDKYSDETPRKDYVDYRADVSAKREARENKERGDFSFKGPKSLQVRRQELIAHLNSYQETFNSVEDNIWLSIANDLLNKLRGR